MKINNSVDSIFLLITVRVGVNSNNKNGMGKINTKENKILNIKISVVNSNGSRDYNLLANSLD